MQQQVTASISPEVVKKALNLTRAQYKVARKLERSYMNLAVFWGQHGPSLSAKLICFTDPDGDKIGPGGLVASIDELLSGLIDRENGAAADALAKIADLEALERRIGMLITPATGGFMPPSGGSPSRLPA